MTDLSKYLGKGVGGSSWNSVSSFSRIPEMDQEGGWWTYKGATLALYVPRGPIG